MKKWGRGIGGGGGHGDRGVRVMGWRGRTYVDVYVYEDEDTGE